MSMVCHYIWQIFLDYWKFEKSYFGYNILIFLTSLFLLCKNAIRKLSFREIIYFPWILFIKSCFSCGESDCILIIIFIALCRYLWQWCAISGSFFSGVISHQCLSRHSCACSKLSVSTTSQLTICNKVSSLITHATSTTNIIISSNFASWMLWSCKKVL